MSNNENFPIEQLWYTWSDVGLSSIHSGFRVRAASPGLTEIYSERVKSMDRYMRYVLPPDTNRALVTPDTAPIGLSFIRRDWKDKDIPKYEYLLVHKNYSGKDGVGRPGNFFVHVIALGESYSPRFTVDDAIWLWDAQLWRTNDQELERRSNSLNFVSENTLLASNPRFDPQFRQIRQVLPFLIEAYLSRRGRTPLYIAAPASQVAQIAYLIAGLTLCLPKQLLADLTFSTYEPDVTKATTEIVGTSWIAASGGESSGAQVFSPQFYREKLAVNCFTGDHSLLQSHPLATYNPLAADFAAYATNCLVDDTMDQLDDLSELAERSRELTIDLFLQLYNNEIANADSMSTSEIERYLADAQLRTDRLGSQTFRKKVIESSATNTQWAEDRLRAQLDGLRMLAEKERLSWPASNPLVTPLQEASLPAGVTQGRPKRSQKQNQAGTKKKKAQVTLAEGLALLAKRAIPVIVDALKKAWAASDRQGIATETEQQKVELALTLISLMSWCLTTQNAPATWQQLLEELQKTPTALGYVKIHWDIRLTLLRYWSRAFQGTSTDTSIVDSLVIVSWKRLASFLKANLYEQRKHWNTIVVEKLANDPSLTSTIAQKLGSDSSHEINDLVAQHVQERRASHMTIFLIRLFEQGYPAKSLPPSTHITPLLTELEYQKALPLAQNLIITLTHAMYGGNISYQECVERILDALMRNASGYELLDILVKSNYPRKPQLIEVLLTSGYMSLDACVMRIYPTLDEQNNFFLSEGRNYLKKTVHIQGFISLYQNFLRVSFLRDKLDRLFIMLEAPLDEKTIIALLTNTPLEETEQIQLLALVGQRYLLQSQKMPTLALMIVEWFTQLARKFNMYETLFKLLTPQLNASFIDSLLKAVALQPKEQISFLERYGESYVVQYSDLPILLEYISTYIWTFNMDILEQNATLPSFFSFLLKNYERLPLDHETKLHIQDWAIIYKYCTTKTITRPQELHALATAIYRTDLTENTRFKAKLVHAFVSNITAPNDLNIIVDHMCLVPQISKNISLLLYDISAHAARYAKTLDGNQFLHALFPYIVFALTWQQEERTYHFIHDFLDTLLRDLDVKSLKGWRMLDDMLKKQLFSKDAQDQWSTYLQNLEILDRLTIADNDGKILAQGTSAHRKWSQRSNIGRPIPK